MPPRDDPLHETDRMRTAACDYVLQVRHGPKKVRRWVPLHLSTAVNGLRLYIITSVHTHTYIIIYKQNYYTYILECMCVYFQSISNITYVPGSS